jgi:hypothetical protein
MALRPKPRANSTKDNGMNQEELLEYMNPTTLIGKYRDDRGKVGFLIYDEVSKKFAFGTSEDWTAGDNIDFSRYQGCMLDHLRT